MKKRYRALPVVLLGVAGYVLWQKRDQLDGIVDRLKARVRTAGGDGTASPVTDAGRPADTPPADYDWNRPGVFTSTAMAGPKDGAGDTEGLDGASMGTGTEGEGAR